MLQWKPAIVLNYLVFFCYLNDWGSCGWEGQWKFTIRFHFIINLKKFAVNNAIIWLRLVEDGLKWPRIIVISKTTEK